MVTVLTLCFKKITSPPKWCLPFLWAQRQHRKSSLRKSAYLSRVHSLARYESWERDAGSSSRWLLCPYCTRHRQRQGQGSNSPSRCASSKQQSHFIPGDKNLLWISKANAPGGSHQTHPTKVFDELLWQTSTSQINDQKEYSSVSVEEDKFSLGFEDPRHWTSQLATALSLPAHTKPHHGSFPSYIFFQWLFINLSGADSASVLCFICKTMTTKWLEIFTGLVYWVGKKIPEVFWVLCVWNSFSTHK